MKKICETGNLWVSDCHGNLVWFDSFQDSTRLHNDKTALFVWIFHNSTIYLLIYSTSAFLELLLISSLISAFVSDLISYLKSVNLMLFLIKIRTCCLLAHLPHLKIASGILKLLGNYFQSKHGCLLLYLKEQLLMSTILGIFNFNKQKCQ